ncbi:T9SS type A sorting domain-containing protein [Polaribacter gochangensis]|uniref:T9SS type A sorting domain-containing protein n=1 Tax=Polaribacter gochangensis TaxID=3252903 RepID=UPI003904A8F6
MKKELLLLIFFFVAGMSYSQTLNQAANWPNANWTVTGTYTAAGLLSNPTTGAQFKFDDNAVNSGGDNNDIAAESPVINLKPAFDNGEIAVEIQFSISYRIENTETLMVQYYDADASTWVTPNDATAPVNNDTNNDYKSCTMGEDSNAKIVFDVSSFTTNQLQNFRYRFVYNDNDTNGWGFCATSPTITSFKCSTSTNLSVSNLEEYSADLTWSSTNGSDTEWIVEYGIQGFTLGAGTKTQETGLKLITIGNLTPNTSYDFYVQDKCRRSIVSGWAGPFNFTTKVLSIEENSIEGFTLFPNPAKNTLQLDAQEKISEVAVYNILGQQVLLKSPNNKLYNLDISSLNSGLYVLKIKVADKTGSYRLIKE